MRPTNWLFDLIHSLGQSEKRYFRLFASQFGSTPKNYIRLFEYLNNQKVYDENAVKQHFKGEKLAANLASEKNYLFNLILKSMRAYHAHRSSGFIIQEHIKDLHFLSQKRHFEACLSILKKGKKLAKRFDMYAEWLKLLRFERRFVKFLYHDRSKLEVRLQEIISEQRRIRILADLEYQYIELYDHLLALIRQKLYLASPQKKDEAKKLLAGPLLSKLPESISFHGKSYFHLCRAYCFQILDKTNSVLEAYQQNVSLWEANPHRIKDEPFQFQRTLSNFLGVCYQLEKMDAFPRGLELMDQLPKRTLDEKAEYFSNYFYYFFLYHLNQSDLSIAISRIPEVKIGLKKYSNLIPPSRVVAFHYNISVAYFMTGKYSECIKAMVPITHSHFGDVRLDLKRNSLFLVFASHYELNNLELFESLYHSGKRLIMNSGGYSKGEEELFQFFRLVFQYPKISPETTTAFHKTIEELKGSRFENSEISHWINGYFKER